MKREWLILIVGLTIQLTGFAQKKMDQPQNTGFTLNAKKTGIKKSAVKTGSPGQEGEELVRFEHLTVADGLPESSVRAILQDHLGFIWLGTQNGLATYDGFKVRSYDYQPGNVNTLKGRLILSLHEDRHGDIWIGSETLFRFERATQRFIEYPRKGTYRAGEITAIAAIHEDRQGDIWTITTNFTREVGTIEKFSPKTNVWTYFQQDKIKTKGMSGYNIFSDFSNVGFREDKNGRIWVTLTGISGFSLYQFDRSKQQFERFNFNSKTAGESDLEKIDGIATASDGRLYLSSLSGGGLFILDPASGELNHLNHVAKKDNSLANDTTMTAYQDRFGFIWISNPQGIDKYQPATGTFTHYVSDGLNAATPSPGFLRQPVESPEGDLWFITEDGLNFYDRKRDQFTRHKKNAQDGYALQSANFWINQCMIDRDGVLWAGSQGSGVNKKSRINRFSLITKIPGNTNSLQDSTVRVIYEAPSEPGIIWFGTNTGLDKFNKQTGTYTHYYHNNRDKSFISGGPVTAITEDKLGRFWVATNQGLNLMDRVKGSFHFYTHEPSNSNSLGHEHIQSLLAASDGTLWIGTDACLDHFDVSNNKFTHYVKADTSYTPKLFELIDQFTTPDRRVSAVMHPGNNVNKTTSFYLSRPAELLITAMGGQDVGQFDLGWIEDTTGAIIWEMNSTNTVRDGLPWLRAEVVQLPAGTYRVGYKSDGRYSYNKWTYIPPYHPELWGIQVTRVNKEEAGIFKKELQHRTYNGIGDNSISFLIEDSKKNIWIGSGKGGITKYNPVTGQFINWMDYYRGPFDITGSILQDTRTGNFWVGDFINGLLLMDQSGKVLDRYNSTNGLSDNSIFGIQKDNYGTLWLSTRNGLRRFDTATRRFWRYGISNGLQSEEFYPNASAVTADGQIYFGGLNGANTFYPGKIKVDTSTPQVVLSDLDIAGRPATLGKGNKMTAHISVTGHGNFSYDQNDLTFHFTSISFNRGNENKFAYKLLPNDKDWVQAGTLRQVRYTNLNPGSYTFIVKAANADGFWNKQGTSFSFEVLPPWWKTWWAYVLYVLIATGAIYFYIKQRERSLRVRHKILEQIVTERTGEVMAQKERAEQSEQFKQQFLANMSHEIRTPINAVMGMTNLVLDSPLNDRQKFYIDGIKSSSENLLYIINDILDISKIEAGKMEIEQNDFSLREMVEQVRNLLLYKADEKGLELIINIDSKIPPVLMGDPVRLKQILINLTGNAIKFTRKGSVTILIQQSTGENNVQFSIIDTGVGIPADKLQMVFESFSQAHASDTREFGGTGLGLTISKQLVELMGGKIIIESEEGSGTVFSFEINCRPGSTDRLKDQQIEDEADGAILNGLRILLVDDNEYNRIIVSDILKSKAFVEITEATNGKDALDLVAGREFDVILMDVQMPVMDGYEATRHLKREFAIAGKHIPIIALTASVIRSDLDKCRAAGMDDYVPKPFKVSHLVEAIAKAGKRQNGSVQKREELKRTVSPSTTVTPSTVTDLSYLQKLCEGDKDRIKRYIDMFLNSAPAFIKKIHEAAEEEDHEELLSQMHSYKMKWTMMGMNDANNNARLIEEMCRQEKKAGKIKEKIRQLTTLTEKAMTELEKF